MVPSKGRKMKRIANILSLMGVAVLLCVAFVVPAEAQSPGPPPSGSTIACNYDCLVGMMNKYLVAMVKHDPGEIPLAKTLKYTEDAAQIPMGDGLWLSSTQGPTTFKIIAADPYAGQVAALVVMKQWDKPILLAVRLRIVNGQITEIEHVIASDLRPSAMANLKTPRKAFLTDVPRFQRTSRAKMLSAANGYFNAIEQSKASLAPFASDCVRHENGMQTTSNKTPPKSSPLTQNTSLSSEARARLAALGCAAQINAHLLSYITKIRPRHLLVIDQRKGLVFGFPRFVHRGNVRSIKVVGVPGVDTIPMNFGPIDLQAAEIFKIRRDEIHEIEAIGFLNAYLTKTGWEDEYGTDEGGGK